MCAADWPLSESELLPLVDVDVLVAVVVVVVVDVEAVRLVVFLATLDRPLFWPASLRFVLVADAFLTSR